MWSDIVWPHDASNRVTQSTLPRHHLIIYSQPPTTPAWSVPPHCHWVPWNKFYLVFMNGMSSKPTKLNYSWKERISAPESCVNYWRRSVIFFHFCSRNGSKSFYQHLPETLLKQPSCIQVLTSGKAFSHCQRGQQKCFTHTQKKKKNTEKEPNSSKTAGGGSGWGSGFLIWACCYHSFPLLIFQHISWVQCVPERPVFHLRDCGSWSSQAWPASLYAEFPLGKWPITISLFVSLRFSLKSFWSLWGKLLVRSL